MVGRHLVLEQREQLHELLRKVVGRGLAAVALERKRGELVGAGRAAEAQVDAIRAPARPGC